MSWSGLASNQAVSYNDLQDAVTTGIFAWGGTSIPISNQCLYKNLATITNYAIVTLNGSRGNTDLLIQTDFTSGAGSYVTLYGSNIQSHFSPPVFVGYNSAAGACSAGVTAYIETAYYSGSLTTGTRLLLSTSGYQYITDATHPYYYYSGGWIQIGLDSNGYYVSAKGTCLTAFTVNYGTGAPLTTCTSAKYPSSTTIYGSVNYLVNNNYYYSDSGGVNPVNSTPFGYQYVYDSNGCKYGYFNGTFGSGSADGKFIQIGTCTTCS